GGAPLGPSGLLCDTVFVAYGGVEAAKRLGLSVPGEVSVVGYNDLDLSSWAIFDLTTVRQPLAEMARTAAELLLARIDGAAGAPVHRDFAVELVARGSSGPASR
uniref:substrate-binding domain-containing protein n=1 Tax=Nocardia farcinica TaxID=37329 RepID=UPI0024586A02